MELKESINLFKGFSLKGTYLQKKSIEDTAYPRNDSLNKLQITLSDLLSPCFVQDFHNTGVTSTSLIPNQKVDL